MPYTPQSEQEIVSNMIQTYSALIPTVDDFNRGSVIRSAFTAFATELKRYYTNQTENTAILQQTAGYGIFNFQRLQAQAAYTMETFNVTTAPSSNVTVPAGTIVDIPGTTVQYQTDADNTWPSGSTSQTFRVVCTEAGALGNTPENTITELVTPIPGLSNVTVTNSKAVITGRDLETDAERAQRFTNFLPTIHRGDLQALKYGAMTTQIIDDYGYIQEQVTKAQVVEGSGSNSIYIDNGTYDTSTALVNQCQQVINGYVDASGNYVDGYKAAGIPSTVYAAALQQVTVTASVSLEPGYTLATVEQTISDNITALVQGLDVGDTLYLADIRLAIGNVPGVLNYTVSAPTADTVPANGTLLQLASGSPSISQS